jgi:hypothetical protein
MCEHKNFGTDVNIFNLEDSNSFNAEIRITCLDCHQPFKFIGVPMGLNIVGPPTMSPDQIELRVSIAPLDDEDLKRVIAMNPIKGPKQ